MNHNKLVFNGINGATGEYGLAPMTVEELTKRIGELHSYNRQETEKLVGQRAQLEKLLGGENADKIAAIVRLLAESCLEEAPRNAAWREAWLKKLAEVIASLFPGEEYRRPEKRKELEDRLRVDTAEKMAQIVGFLASKSTWKSDQAKKLEALLLRDPNREPEYGGIPGQLDREFKLRLDSVRRELKRAGRAEELQQDIVAQRKWLQVLARDLRTIPMDAYDAKQTTKPKAAAQIVVALKELTAAGMPACRPLDGLRQEMDAPQSRDASWNSLVDTLHDRLDALIATGDSSVPWSQLLDLLDRWLGLIFQGTPLNIRGVIEGVDRTKVQEAGWGLIFPWEDPQSPGKVRVAEIKEALEPLLRLRQSQAGELFRLYEGGKGYRPNETAQEFLERHGASVHNPADPQKVPCYLLIVGSPEQIPFHFQYQLDVQYAVGRLDFDRVEDYASYARSVVAAESLKLAPTATFFGVSNPDDDATRLSAERLVKPLHEHIQQRFGPPWQVKTILGDEARKARLQRLLGGDETPALLFAACHGLEFDKDDPQERQVRYQGALLCQDWRGPLAERGEIPTDYYLSGEDLTDDTNLLGLIGFFFACYSAGTPLFDEYYQREFRESGKSLTERPFIAALPKAMLSRPKGGALAVVGHVERAWGTSYMSSRQKEQIAHFESAVEHLLKGHPIGSALEYFNGRYAALSTELTHAMQPAWGKKQPSDYELAELWTANNDARGYIVLGDPAVRLPVAEEGEAVTGRPALGE